MIERWATSRAGQLGWLAAQGPRQPRFPFRSEAAIERAQRRRVAATIRYAYRHVPHYRETMRRIGLSPAEITTATDLARLPVIDRSELQRDPERFVSRAHPIEHYVPLRTGGSSGAPVIVFHDPGALIRAGAYHQRAGALHRAVAGKRLGCRTLAIGHLHDPGRAPVDATLSRLGHLVGASKRIVSVLDPIERSVQEINSFRPHILTSFGSYLEELFVYLHATGTAFHRPSLVRYSSDAMSARARALITETFGIPVLSSYGAYEAFSLGFECSEHLGHHLNVDLCPVRLTDSEGREVPFGERGEVVISNLVNRGTILLNYRLGDVSRRLPGPCPCGRTLPLLAFVQGRVGDWLMMPSGQRLHPETVADIVDEERDVIRYQAVQTAATRLTVKLVVAPGSSRDVIKQRVERAFAERIGSRVGPQITTEVRFVDDLPRSARGKVRTVVGLDAAQAVGVIDPAEPQ